MKQQVRRIVLGQLVLQGLLALVALGAGAVPLGVFLGVLAGLEDTLLVLWGILSGMGKPPRQAALSMHRLMFLRIGSAAGLDCGCAEIAVSAGAGAAQLRLFERWFGDADGPLPSWR